MKQIPISFSEPMVRALLEGRKTMTRRIIKTQRIKPSIWSHVSIGAITRDPATGLWRARAGQFNSWSKPFSLPYAIGDRLWVRERMTANRGLAYYSADGASTGDKAWWKNYERKDLSPLAMPRSVSRTTLIVTDVKVERLQEISEADAIAEGVECDSDGWKDYLMPATQSCLSATDSFETLWRSLHGPDAWAANPWVVAPTFTVHRCNIDKMQEAI